MHDGLSSGLSHRLCCIWTLYLAQLFVEGDRGLVLTVEAAK